MPHARTDRIATKLGNESGNALRNNQVVKNGRSRKLMQQTIRYRFRHLRTIYYHAMLIDGKHAVCVSVKGGSEVGSGLTNLLLHIYHVLGLDGTCGMVGEATIKLKLQWNELTGKVFEHTWQHHSCHAVPCINDYFEWLDLSHINK